MNIDDRIEALTMNLELAFRDIEALRTKIDQTTQNIDRLVGVVETLANVAQGHERRITSLEGGTPQ